MVASGERLPSLWSPWSGRSIAIASTVWAVIAFLSGASTIAARVRVGAPPRVGDALGEAGIVCATFALLTPLALAAGRRWPVHRLGARAFGAHCAMALLYWVVSATLSFVGTRLLLPSAAPLAGVLTSSAFGAVLAYVATVGIARLIDAAAEVRERERQLAGARIHALTGQLRPHFLFNALNAVATLIPRDPAAAQRLVLDLSKLLRMSLERGGDGNVTLADEIALIEAYLAVMRARIGDRLSVTWSVPQDLLGAQVPQLLMLPLVENALKHGITRREDAGALAVRAAREGEHIRLTVTDDGPGPSAAPVDGFGFAATRDRLERQFADDFELALRVAEPRGAEATVRLPLRFA